jgi:hypothetical protein
MATHNGNLNRSKVPATGVEGLKSTGKSNGTEATLRKGNLPKASAVTTVDRNANSGAHAKSVLAQNISLTSDGTKILNVLTNSGKAFLSHDKGGEDATGHE